MPPSTPAAFGITWDHIHLRTPDVEATAVWFREMLGAEIVRSPGRTDLALGGAKIFLAQMSDGDGVAPPPTPPHQGLDHFAFSVVDIDTLAEQLKAKGVAFTTEPLNLRPGLRICFIRGPQGISIELLERDPKYT